MLLRVLPRHSDWLATHPKRDAAFFDFVRHEFGETSLAISVYSLPVADYQASRGRAALVQTLAEHRAGALRGNPSRTICVDLDWTESWGLWKKAPATDNQPYFKHLSAAHQVLRFGARQDLEEFAHRLLSEYHSSGVNNTQPLSPWYGASSREIKAYGKGRIQSVDAEWGHFLSDYPTLTKHWS